MFRERVTPKISDSIFLGLNDAVGSKKAVDWAKEVFFSLSSHKMKLLIWTCLETKTAEVWLRPPLSNSILLKGLIFQQFTRLCYPASGRILPARNHYSLCNIFHCLLKLLFIGSAALQKSESLNVSKCVCFTLNFSCNFMQTCTIIHRQNVNRWVCPITTHKPMYSFTALNACPLHHLKPVFHVVARDWLFRTLLYPSKICEGLYYKNTTCNKNNNIIILARIISDICERKNHRTVMMILAFKSALHILVVWSVGMGVM